MEEVVVVKFRNGCRPYYFKKGNFTPEYKQEVIVDTAHGNEFAIVTNPCKQVPDEAIVAPLKSVIRPANDRDREILKRNDERKPQAMQVCREKIAARNLPMKLIDCEFVFDGSKVIFYFSAEERVDFRELVKDLAAVFRQRIDLRQIGIRDETQHLGGIAPCGRVCCCASCMSEFSKVSIKMAKNQGLSLNPGKISGLCGRLMCCLSYENDYYAEVYTEMPKVQSTVTTPEGPATVVSVNMLKKEAKVKVEKDGALFYRDYPVSQLTYKKNGGKAPSED